MAFPIIPIVAALLSDQQSRTAEKDAIARAGTNAHQGILRRRASELGGSPYGMMAEDFSGQLNDIKAQAEAGRNNQIGNLLQAYLKKDDKKKKGDNDDEEDSPGQAVLTSGVESLFGDSGGDLEDPWSWSSGL